MTQTDVSAHYLLQEGTNHWTTAGLFVVDDALLQTICFVFASLNASAGEYETEHSCLE